MKYVVATLLSAAVLFLFAVFAVAVGWRHGGGYLVQAALWSIIAVLWAAIVKNWESITARLQKKGSDGLKPILDENVKFTILAGLIIIVGAGLFFAMRASARVPGDKPHSRAITGQDFMIRVRTLNPEWHQYSDEDVVWAMLRNNPDSIRIVLVNGKEWK